MENEAGHMENLWTVWEQIINDNDHEAEWVKKSWCWEFGAQKGL